MTDVGASVYFVRARWACFCDFCLTDASVGRRSSLQCFSIPSSWSGFMFLVMQSVAIAEVSIHLAHRVFLEWLS